jgi:anti-sigma factor RsiW
MSQTFQDHEIRQYLLGDLSPAEEEQIETTYFRQPELLARVELARDDLADDYAAGRLSEVDRGKFERRLLATNEGREQLAITKGLRQNASRHGADRGDSPEGSNDPNDRE